MGNGSSKRDGSHLLGFRAAGSFRALVKRKEKLPPPVEVFRPARVPISDLIDGEDVVDDGKKDPLDGASPRFPRRFASVNLQKKALVAATAKRVGSSIEAIESSGSSKWSGQASQHSTRSSGSGSSSLGFSSFFKISRFGGSGSVRAASATRASFHSNRRELERVQLTQTGSLRVRGDHWPVMLQEAMFLPHFPVRAPVNQESFETVRLLGKGSFGRVYLVRRKNDGMEFAMKVLSKNQVIQRGILKQCREEMTIQTMCGHHPFLVGCKYHWQSHKRLYLVTEFVQRGEMMSLWKKFGPFSEELVKIYVAQITLALDFLHCAGIIYRDLKLENIMLDDDFCVKVTDFGLAKWLAYGKRTGTICGTVQYMAPEILQMRTYNHLVDWWSLGILTYALLVGKFPIEAQPTHEEMLLAVISYDYSLPQEVDFSPSARTFVKSLLCLDPSKRLKNKHAIQREAFLHKLDFDCVYNRTVSPKNEVLRLAKNSEATEAPDLFKDF